MGTRRTLKRKLRDSHGLKRIQDERNELRLKREKREAKRDSTPPTPEDVMWREWMDEVKENAKQANPTQHEVWEVRDGTRADVVVTKRARVDEREVQPTPPHLIGVVTHPVNYQKDESYHHQPLENPSHLWCDAVHATDADVMRGNRKKG